MVNFEALKAFHLEKNSLFEDPEFPNEAEKSKYEWKRPKDIVSNPKFISDGISRFDVQQGELGDCWFIASVASLTHQPKFLHQVVPQDQDFEENYCGIFHFRFWRFDKWVEVIIDDRLPTRNGSLLLMKSSDPNEFWSALLEKAYAKLFGSYAALEGGNSTEAMQDFTGGVTERIELNPDNDENCFQIITNAFKKTSFVSVGIDGESEEVKDGLVSQHAYSVIKIETIELLTEEQLKLVKLRNPWGCTEWMGDWSDNSSCWEKVSPSEKEKLGVSESKDDGEFWMNFDEFLRKFDRMDICYTHPNDMICVNDNSDVCSSWKLNSFHGKWIKDLTAGGCKNNREKYLLNPKYIIELGENDTESDNPDLSIILSLTQKNCRSKNKDPIAVGITVHTLTEEVLSSSSLKLDTSSLLSCSSKSTEFINKRQVCQRIKLGKGVHCIVPCTFVDNEEGEFLLRVYSEYKNKMIEPDETALDTFASEQLLLRTTNEELQNANAEAIELFKKFSGDDNEIEADELKEVLNTALKEDMPTGFSSDICKSMVALKDVDLSGKLEIDEFKRLWADISAAKLVFKNNKTEDSLAAKVISQTFNELGFTISKRVLNVLVLRYGNVERQMKFDDFLLCVIRLKNMTEMYKRKFSNTSNTISLDDWLESTMYL